jgi:segregation and condensation protein B
VSPNQPDAPANGPTVPVPAEDDAGTGVEREEAVDAAVDAAVDPSADPPALADPAELAAAVEAILFVVEAPVTVAALAAGLAQPTAAVEAAVAAVRQSYDERRAGIEVREVAGGVRVFTRPGYAPQVERFLQEGQRSRLTQAALETLAVIAYRQPVTRSRVSAIRGVNVDGVVRTLTSRGLIVEVGSDPETGGGLFRTTELFLEKMGLQSLAELPSLAPLLPDLDGLEYDEL